MLFLTHELPDTLEKKRCWVTEGDKIKSKGGKRGGSEANGRPRASVEENVKKLGGGSLYRTCGQGRPRDAGRAPLNLSPPFKHNLKSFAETSRGGT